MSQEPELRPNDGFAISTLSPHIHSDAANQMMVSAFLYNENANGEVLVEKVDSEFGGPYAGQWYLPGVPLKFNEHPEEAAHRILTEELEVADREVKLLRVQSHKAEQNRWYLMFLYASENLSDKELAEPCDGIGELTYKDLNSLEREGISGALWDIMEADKVGNQTYE